jgi:hypothetical protein
MAKRGGLTGAIKGMSQLKNPKTNRWTTRGPDGRFKRVKKSDDQPFKSIRKEK